MRCPACGSENIEGVDHCEECGTALAGLEVEDSVIERHICQTAVSELHPPSPLCIGPDATVAQAIELMVQHHVGSLLVTQDGRLVGILSERDILYKVDPPDGLDRPVQEIMTPRPEAVTADDPIAVALQQMDIGGYRHLPVVNDQGAPIGIVSVRDVQRYLCEQVGKLKLV